MHSEQYREQIIHQSGHATNDEISLDRREVYQSSYKDNLGCKASLSGTLDCLRRETETTIRLHEQNRVMDARLRRDTLESVSNDPIFCCNSGADHVMPEYYTSIYFFSS